MKDFTKLKNKYLFLLIIFLTKQVRSIQKKNALLYGNDSCAQSINDALSCRRKLADVTRMPVTHIGKVLPMYMSNIC